MLVNAISEALGKKNDARCIGPRKLFLCLRMKAVAKQERSPARPLFNAQL